MPDWLVISLVVVFAIHFFVFARKALKTREGYYWLLTTTFLLLVASFSMRLLLPDMKVGTISAYMFPRVTAWVFTLLSIALAISRRIKKR